MAGQDQAGGEAGGLKVFISYSRKDVDFADDLELFLDTRGFDPIIDRHDIDHNDDWRARLYELIHGCDVVVFVLTETSAASPICKWEVEEAARLGKRRLVVTPGPLPAGIASPEALGAANWIHCWRNPAVPDSSIAKGKRELERALKTDVDWLRQRTRLMEQAAAWAARGTAVDSPLLLRGEVLAEAQDWARRTPKDETLPEAVATFLNASEAHEARVKAETAAGLAERQAALEKAAKASNRVRRVSLIGGAVAAVLLAVAVTAGVIAWQVGDAASLVAAEAARANQIAFEQKALAEQYLTDAQRQGELARQKSDEANTLQIEATLQAQLAAANLSEAERQAGLAASNLNEAERQAYRAAEGLSNQIAREAGEMETPELAMLFALYADPTARRSDAARNPRWTRPFAAARASLAASTARLEGQGSQALRILEGHKNAVVFAAISPDGATIVTTSLDQTARLWDATASEATRILDGHKEVVWSAAFAPSGETIVTASGDGTARLWQAATGDVLGTLSVHQGRVRFATVSPDGGTIITASGQGEARLWDAKSGKVLRTLKGHVGLVLGAAFSPDGGTIVTASSDGTARLWDAATGSALPGLEGHEGGVTSVAFSPDGSMVLTASDDGTARLWDAKTRRPLRALDWDQREVRAAAISPDGRIIVTAASNGTARLWDAATGIALGTLEGHKGRVYSAVFSPDGRKIVTASQDRTARIWSVPEIFSASAEQQEQIACKQLKAANAALVLPVTMLAAYPVLQGISEDPKNPGFLVSPCKGVLPDEAFAKPR
jgi:WD40 repeat protein